MSHAPLLLCLALALAPGGRRREVAVSAPAPSPRVSAPAPAPAAPFRLVVHPSNPTPALSRAEVADLFLKRTTRWASGVAVLPVDLEDGAPAREAFSHRVLGRGVRAVLAYWQQRLFSGRGVPPPEKAGDAEVLAYVRAHPGAVGYVSPRAEPSGVKTVAVTD